MYVVDGIAYAGERQPAIRVSGVRPLPDHRLWLRFNTGEAKVFDFTPLLADPAFAPLAEEEVFRGVYIDYGVAVWNGGAIDVDPTYLYEHATPAEAANA